MEKQNKEILYAIKEWRQLIYENKKLKQEYENLVAEIKFMKEIAIKATFGNKIRYRIAKWLMK